jgi:RNA polymerase sigma-70 factor (ECF subfamily)
MIRFACWCVLQMEVLTDMLSPATVDLPRPAPCSILSGSMAGEDAELVYALARGERSALAALYQRHASIMLALARRMLSSARESEDLVHDVFVEAWEHAGDYDPTRGSVRQWLLVRLRSRAVDRLRSATRTTSEPAVPIAEPTGPDVLLDAHRARRALADLPREQIQVLELAYFKDLSASAIAAELGIPEGTVKSRLAAGLSRLRASFRPDIEEVGT